MQNIIVVDTETVTGTYGLLSVGVVMLSRSSNNIKTLDTYFGFSDEFDYGFYFVQQYDYAYRNRVKRKPRCKIESELADLVQQYGVTTAYAYNAHFDKTVVQAYLSSLQFDWLDLMKSARRVLASEEHYPVYKKIHPHIELTRNGILKRGYSVECVGRYSALT
ncbi:hypothetical protein FACS1894216_15130 [Synergistales bacterium]|nr:hypothetical protein FACS1894216_15130 [Synergistales bacterium]